MTYQPTNRLGAALVLAANRGISIALDPGDPPSVTASYHALDQSVSVSYYLRANPEESVCLAIEGVEEAIAAHELRRYGYEVELGTKP